MLFEPLQAVQTIPPLHKSDHEDYRHKSVCTPGTRAGARSQACSAGHPGRDDHNPEDIAD